MEMSQQDREWLEFTVKEICERVSVRVIETHIKLCPHGQSMLKNRLFFAGLIAGTGLCSGSIGGLIVKLLMAGS